MYHVYYILCFPLLLYRILGFNASDSYEQKIEHIQEVEFAAVQWFTLFVYQAYHIPSYYIYDPIQSMMWSIYILYVYIYILKSVLFHFLVLAKGGSNLKATITELARKPQVQSYSFSFKLFDFDENLIMMKNKEKSTCPKKAKKKKKFSLCFIKLFLSINRRIESILQI